MRRNEIPRWIPLLGTAGLMALLFSFLTLYSDDYQYATFFRGGLSAFWDKTVHHYIAYNGRAFIHFLDELFLLGRTTVYTLLFPLMMAVGLLLGEAAQSAEDSLSRSAIPAALSMLLVLALPVKFLNQTLCWVTGSFNYCFPVLLALAFFYALVRALRTPSVGKWIAATVLGFLVGATTEQVGCTAVMGSVLLLIRARCTRNAHHGTNPPPDVVHILCQSHPCLAI